jgi:hypothetical protein
VPAGTEEAEERKITSSSNSAKKIFGKQQPASARASSYPQTIPIPFEDVCKKQR